MLKPRWFVALAFVALCSGFLSNRASGFGETRSARELPSFSLPDTQGVVHNIDEWKGRVLVINFWATWCAPCLEEIPRFVELQGSYAKQGLQFIGIAVEDAEAVLDYANKAGINYPILVAGLPGLGLSSDLGNPAGVVPFSVVVNRDRRIVHEHVGVFSLEQIQESVIPLL